MAAVTHRYFEMYDGQLFLEVDYDDVTENFTEARVVNNLGRPAHVVVRRANGTVWRQGNVPPGTFTMTAQGQVRKLADIPSMGLTA